MISENSTGDTNYQRNGGSHATGVKDDLEVLRLLESHGEGYWVAIAMDGYELLYGRSVNELQPSVADTPEEIVGFLDRRSILKSMAPWTDLSAEERQRWVSLCDGCIDTWSMVVSSKTEKNLSYLGHDMTTSEYNRLCQWMRNKDVTLASLYDIAK